MPRRSTRRCSRRSRPTARSTSRRVPPVRPGAAGAWSARPGWRAAGAPVCRWLERLSTLIEQIAGLFLAAITVLVFASAIGRYAFATPLPDAFDISRLLLGVAMLWGFASVGYRGAHIKVELIAEVLPARAVLLARRCSPRWCCWCSPCCSPGSCSGGSRAPTPAPRRPSICGCRCGRGSRRSGWACSPRCSRSPAASCLTARVARRARERCRPHRARGVRRAAPDDAAAGADRHRDGAGRRRRLRRDRRLEPGAQPARDLAGAHGHRLQPQPDPDVHPDGRARHRIGHVAGAVPRRVTPGSAGSGAGSRSRRSAPAAASRRSAAPRSRPRRR